MSLQDKLDTYKAGFLKQVPADVLAVMTGATEDLRNSGILDATIKVGDTLPPFTLKSQSGEDVSSADLLAKGPLVISYFRGDWCPYCNIELEALQEASDQFEAAGATLIAIAPQTADWSQKTRKKNDLTFDILVDAGNAYAKKLGTVFALPEALREIYKGFKIDLSQYNGDDSWELPMPTRLVIGQDGKVAYADINPDYTVRPEPGETLEAVKKLG